MKGKPMRLLNPATNPAGWMSAIGAVLAATVMITNALHHHGIIDATVVVSAAGAVMALFTRQVVTPVSDPKSADGVPLVPAPELATGPSDLPPGTYGSPGIVTWTAPPSGQ